MLRNEVNSRMSIPKAFVLVLIVLASSNAMVSLVSAACSQIDAVTGDTITLQAPPAPTGVKYFWLWTVTDVNKGTTNLTSHEQNTAFIVPSNPASLYNVTLEVGSGIEGGTGGLTGCVLESCLHINVHTQNSCSIQGDTSICNTDDNVYRYTGNADTGKTAYLNWYVDRSTHPNVLATGQSSVSVHWPTYWLNGPNAETHIVSLDVLSKKTNNVLSTCTFSVKVLPSPVTTISAV